MPIANDSDFIEFFDSFLPELEFSLQVNKRMSSEFPRMYKSRAPIDDYLRPVIDKLDELKRFYSNHVMLSLSRTTEPQRTVVITVTPRLEWVAEVKGCVLFADRVVCQDPFLYLLAEYQEFGSYNMNNISGYHYADNRLAKLEKQLGHVWEVLSLVHAGLLIFCPLEDPGCLGLPETIRSVVRKDSFEYLREHIEIREVQGGFPVVAKVFIPVLDYEELEEISISKLGDGWSCHSIAVQNFNPILFGHALMVTCALRAADLVTGTFWSSNDWHWKLSREVLKSISADTKVYSFIHTFASPALEDAPTESLISIRNQEEAFFKFRREMLLARDSITSFPNEDTFSREASVIYNDVFKPNFAMIDAAMRRNSLLSNMPWFMASAGFAYAGVTTAGGPASAAIFGALSAAFGFGPAFKDIAEKRASIRREPAYVFWKLDKDSKKR